MAEKTERKTRNEQIAEMLENGELLKNFYRFTAQNPHIELHDACQIVLVRPKASICFYIDEWNDIGRRVTKNQAYSSIMQTVTSNTSMTCTTRTAINAIAGSSIRCAGFCTVLTS